MKGLLVKDFKLLKVQKNFFFIIIVMAVGMAVFTNDVTFILGYLTFIIPLFSLSTISYDEFDNGNAFLFTLPVSRSGYVTEKYCFSLLLGFGSWVLAIILAMFLSVLNSMDSVSDLFISSPLLLSVMLIIQAVMIPLQIKFGAEKGRIAMIAIIGLTIAIGIGIVKGLKMLGIDILNIVNNPPTVNMAVIISIVIAVTISALLLSMKISTAIMKRKEF